MAALGFSSFAPVSGTQHVATTACNVRENRSTAVAAYAVGLDNTLWSLEERSLRKSIDRYTVLGPLLVTADEIGGPDDIEISLTLMAKCASGRRSPIWSAAWHG